MEPGLSTDPVVRHVAQPLVDRTGIDPRSTARRSAEIFMMAVLTVSALNLATVDARLVPGLYMSEAWHVVFGGVLAWTMTRWADIGQAVLAGPHGWVHAFGRLMGFVKGCYALYQVVMFHVSGLASLVPTSAARQWLTLAEAIAMLCSLYFGICRRPPPRRRRETIDRQVTA